MSSVPGRIIQIIQWQRWESLGSGSCVSASPSLCPSLSSDKWSCSLARLRQNQLPLSTLKTCNSSPIIPPISSFHPQVVGFVSSSFTQLDELNGSEEEILQHAWKDRKGHRVTVGSTGHRLGGNYRLAQGH